MDVTPEQLAEILIVAAANGTGSFAQSNLQDMDNEMVVQISAHIFKHIMTLSQCLGYSEDDDDEDESITVNNEELFSTVNMILLMIGFTMHHEQIDRQDLNKIVHYAKITNTELVRSKYHPIYLMSFMPEDSAPEVYKKLMFNSDYLPNIVLLFDPKPLSDKLYTIVIQKVNIHFRTRG